MGDGDSSDAIAGVVTGLSVSHATADVATIERASVDHPPDEVRQLLDHAAVEEAFVLQTCNRAERYIVTEDGERARAVLSDYLPGIPGDACTLLSHDASLEHLLRVGAGLESMVIGEDQILGQLQQARTDADRAGGVGDLLEEVVWKAIHVGRQARTHTAINDGIQSLSRAAVDLVDRRVSLAESSVLVLGAGDMAERTVTAAVDAGANEISIVNRTIERARTLANAVEGAPAIYDIENLPHALAEADVLVTATASPHYLVTPDLLNATGRTVVVDIGQPRDVDPSVRRIDTVELFDLDDLESTIHETARSRADAEAAVESLIDRELAELQDQLKRRQADDVIAAMYTQAERIKQQELAEVQTQFGRNRELTDHEEEVLASFADALVGKLMAAPTKSLREAAEDDDWETIQVGLQLFDPGFATGNAAMEDVPDRFEERVPIEDD